LTVYRDSVRHDCQRVHAAIRRNRSPHVVFFGAWSHTPNAEGAVWLAKHVWPAVLREVPEASLILAGPGTPPGEVLNGQAVEHLGRVDSLAHLLGQARVAVVPIVRGIGARVKFVEALASGAAVVSTAIGAEGYSAEGAYLRADDPQAFARGCIDLLRDADRAEELGRAGRSLALGRLRWEQTAAPISRWVETFEQLRA
jgi:glycosyltransferase involved in cell wall biosynthesis